MQKRVLFLGAAYAQVPIIQEAKNRGWYIITCDYLPDNPGHKLANEYYNISTTDFQGVLDLAKKVNPDFVIAYASDPAAPTAAYVSEQLGLPGNSYKSVQLLSEKDLFRKFLSDNGFNTPKSVSILDENDFEKVTSLSFPIIIKPTDSSGSKGITRVDFSSEIKAAVEYALSFSRNKRAIAEEYIDNSLGDIHGDGFVVDGKLAFSYLGDHIYNTKSNIYNPCGTTWPSKINDKAISQLEQEINRLIHLTGFSNGPINIEARINNDGKTYIMEIGPRSGGHFVPQAIKYGTGFNMVNAILDSYISSKIIVPKKNNQTSAYYALHSDEEGVLKSIEIKKELNPFIKEFHQYIHHGEKVYSFHGANAAIGVLLLLFNSQNEMDYYIENMNKFVEIKIDTSLL
jgi:biotin carboxylase